jgi:hypothetical protein
LALATSALVASIAMADSLFVKNSQALAELRTEIIPITNFNDSAFTTKPILSENYDFSKALAPLPPLDLNSDFDLD